MDARNLPGILSDSKFFRLTEVDCRTGSETFPAPDAFVGIDLDLSVLHAECLLFASCHTE